MIKMIAQVANNGRKMLGSSAEGGGEQVGHSGGDGGFDLVDHNSDNHIISPW